jgi:GrpB-like predicted nucleotidyltransferase (UPF0157 family)
MNIPTNCPEFELARQQMLRAFNQWLQSNPSEEQAYQAVEETLSAMQQLYLLRTHG